MKRVYIETFGCTANMNDAEIMAGLLTRAGFMVVSDPKLADITIINTCIVKGQTEAQMKRLLKSVSDEGKGSSTVVTGCMPEVALDEIESIVPEASVVGTHNIPKIVEAVAKLTEGKRTVLTGSSDLDKLGLPRIQMNPVVGTIQINEGCTGGCAYCIVKRVKPHLRSYSERRIIKAAEQSLKAGCKELWITSQDTAAYGHDRSDKSELPQLLSKLTALPGRFFIRVGMMNPDNVMPVLDNLIDAYDSPKVFKFLHLPVQSGSDRVLKRMGRKYTVKQFEHIANMFRERFPDMVLATDIICGFPTETDEEFEETLELVRRTRPTVINISRYTERPGTPATKMKAVHGRITKDRSTKLTNLFHEIALEEHKKYLGKDIEILIDEKGKDSSSLGRDGNYRQIAIKKKMLLGARLKAKVIGAHIHYLEATRC